MYVYRDTKLCNNIFIISSVAASDAIAAATGRWLEREPEAFILGEEIANFGGGAYGATKGLPDKFPDRVLNTPLSENGFTGLALGAAMLVVLPPVLVVMFMQRWFVKGLIEREK